MNILIACERSGKVREAFRKKGHTAFSNDLEPADDGSGWHLQQDAILASYHRYFDLMIAHPECTFLANSGAKNLYKGTGNNRRKENGPEPDRWAQMGYAAHFYMTLRNAPIDRKCIENPIMLGHARRLFGIPKHTQIIQPWMFGDYETKATGLDLINLPPLVPTFKTYHECREFLCYAEDEKPLQRMFMMTPSADRKKMRSQTYDGIAQAMANQWG